MLYNHSYDYSVTIFVGVNQLYNKALRTIYSA